MKTVAELIKDYRPLAVLMNAASMVVDEISDKENPSQNEIYLAIAWNVFHQNVRGEEILLSANEIKKEGDAS